MIAQSLYQPLYRPQSFSLEKNDDFDIDRLSLDLAFALDKTLTARKGPTPTFSRASSATQVGATGLIEYAPENLYVRSQEFNDANWLKTNVTLSSGILDPLSGTSAFKLIETATTGTHVINSTVTPTTIPHTLSIFAKKGERNWIVLRLGAVNTFFNLDTGTFTPSSNPAAITDVGNGWYRCSVTSSAGTQGSYRMSADGVTDSYTGDGTSGIFIFGAQLERHPSARTYIPTTTAAVYGARFDHDPVTLASRGLLVEEARTNLMPGSNNFTGYWVTGGGSLSSAANVAPDGAANSFLFSENTATSAHRFFQSFTGVSGTTYTTSVFLKFAGRTQVFIETRSITSNPFAVFDIQSGTVVQVSSGITATMQQFPNGWWRCSITGTANAAGGNTLIGGFVSGSQSYTGSGSAAFYAFGAQVEAGSFATSYIPTTTTALTRSADVCSITGANFTSFYNAIEGSLFTSHYRSSGQGGIATISNGGTDIGKIQIFQFSNGTYEATIKNSSNVVVFQRGYSPVAGEAKTIMGYRLNDSAASSNGSIAVTDTTVAIDTNQAFLFIGNDVLNRRLNGHIARIQYFRKRLPNAKLQALTAP